MAAGDRDSHPALGESGAVMATTECAPPVTTDVAA